MRQETKKMKDKKEETRKKILKPDLTYKDHLFRLIFKEKKELLELYNGLNGTGYSNPDDLIVNTLENAVYLGMKNDVSFVLDNRLMLYEHQATKNPNMPLRNLFYVADLYSGITKDKNLYGSRTITIPEPKFVVFYNGTAELPERFELRLSDAYVRHVEAPMLELKTLVININAGYNEELMSRCQTLREYMIFVNKVRCYLANTDFKDAVEQAIEECIQEGVLQEFLSKNKAEVLKVSIYEYDEAKHIRMEREDAMQEGFEEGEQFGRKRQLSELIEKKLLKGKTVIQIAEDLEEKPEVIEALILELKNKI